MTLARLFRKYASANTGFIHTEYVVSDLVKLSLIDAYVLPIMTYAFEAVLSLTRGQHDELLSVGITCFGVFLTCINGNPLN